MATTSRVRGTGRYIRRLNNEIKNIEGKTLRGLIRAAIIIIRDMEETPPIIPIDTGNLRASRFVVTSEGSAQMGSNASFEGDDSGKLNQDHSSILNSAKAVAQSSPAGPMVILGFSAYYAAEVHEKVGVNFQRPGAGAKFMQSSLRNKESQILSIIREEARIR